MPRGAYTAKQERKADKIEKSYRSRGTSKKEAERRAWATVNKQDRGGRKSGSGRGRSRRSTSSASTRSWQATLLRPVRMVKRGFASIKRAVRRAV